MNNQRSEVFEDVLYSQCWEDPQIDRRAFAITPDDTVFSITSGGCNVLTFLLDNPQRIIALDVNPYQNYLLDLKIAAFQKLTYDQMLEFFGVRRSESRVLLYLRLRSAMRPESRQYWDAQPKKIAAGVIHCGRYEQYMQLLGACVSLFMGRSLIRKLFEAEDPSWRSYLFHTEWENIWWGFITHILLSRTTMSLLFDSAFFRYVERDFSFGKHFAAKVERAFTELPMKQNYFLSYILLGQFYSEEYLPPYLRRENFETIRDRAHRIELVCASCERFFSTLQDSSITKFNFSNIFEWMSVDAFEELLRETWRVARDSAILTYRNLLVPRERPSKLAESILSLKAEAQELHRQDLSFIYNNYVVEQIRKPVCLWNTASKRCAIAEP